MQTVVEIIRYCTTLVEFNSKLLSRKHWDFGVISLVSWTENILKAKAQFEDAGVSAKKYFVRKKVTTSTSHLKTACLRLSSMVFVIILNDILRVG